MQKVLCKKYYAKNTMQKILCKNTMQKILCGKYYAESTLRPLALLEASTLRPFVVLILLRKP